MAKKSAPAAQPVATETTAAQSVRDYLHSMVDDMCDAPQISWKRQAMGFVVGIALSLGAGYVTGYLFTILAVGAALITGSVFIFYLIWVLGLLLAMYFGAKASLFGYTKVVDKSIDRAWNKVTGWFKSEPGVQHAA